jgi:hypothetical protein
VPLPAQAATCPAVPRTGCLTSERASFQIRDSDDDAKDQLKWSWSKGAAFDQPQLGNPAATTGHALCVYDSSGGTNALRFGVEVDPSLAWDDRAPRGWAYKDGLGSQDGVENVQLRAGSTGKTKARLKAAGMPLPLPGPVDPGYFAQDPRLTVQLINDEAVPTCWSSVFTEATENSADAFRAKSFAPPSTTTSTTTSSTTTTTLGPVCGNAIVEPGETCESDGDCAAGDVCALTCQCVPGQGCPEWIELTTRAAGGAMSGATELDYGWTGMAHDLDLSDQARLALGIASADGSGPDACGTATIAGVDPRPGNCRCNQNNHQICNEPFSVDADDCDIPRSCTTDADCRVCSVTTSMACTTAESCPTGEYCMTGPFLPTCAGGQCAGTCQCFEAPPEPQQPAAASYCVLRRMQSDVTGTWNLDTGEHLLETSVRYLRYLGETIAEPCPTCAGDATPNDGDRDGVCVNGHNDGASCDANALNVSLPGGDPHSYDCMPSSGKNVSGAGQLVSARLTTETQSFSATVECGFSIAPESCPCGICSGDTTVACSSNSDCTGFGTCGRLGEGNTRPNGCTDGVCNAVADGEGECDTGPDDTYCDGLVQGNGRPFVGCNTNSDCEATDCDNSTPSPDGCGNCTIVKRRECFLDPLVSTGAASTTDPVSAGIVCLAPVASAGFRALTGLPGPARLAVERSVVARCPGGQAYPPCP